MAPSCCNVTVQLVTGMIPRLSQYLGAHLHFWLSTVDLPAFPSRVVLGEALASNGSH